MKAPPHIVVDQTILPGLSPINLDINLLEATGLIIEKREHDISPHACLEWAIHSLIFAFIAKSYFDGFLGEMGSDHYQKLKVWIIEQNKKFKGLSTTTITATQSTKKITEANSPNNFFAIYLTTPQGNRLKVFMPNCDSNEEDIEALSKLLDNFRKLYTKPKGKFAKKINGLTDKVYEELYAVFNKKLKEWEFYTFSMLAKRSMNTNTKLKK